MPPYPYLGTHYGTQLSLFTHHMWIRGFLIVGAAEHASYKNLNSLFQDTNVELIDRGISNSTHSHRDHECLESILWKETLLLLIQIEG